MNLINLRPKRKAASAIQLAWEYTGGPIVIHRIHPAQYLSVSGSGLIDWEAELAGPCVPAVAGSCLFSLV
jgi:hypothetical protein